jgi:hypothetical protein
MVFMRHCHVKITCFDKAVPLSTHAGWAKLHTFLFWMQDVGQWSVSCPVLVSIRGKTLDKHPRWCGVLAKENNPEPYRKLPVLTRSFPRTVNRIHCPVRVIFSHIYLCGASGLGRLIFEVSGWHTIRHKHARPVVLHWTSDQLVAEAAT